MSLGCKVKQLELLSCLLEGLLRLHGAETETVAVQACH